MSRYDFDESEPYVVIERHSSGVSAFLIGAALGAGVALLLAPRSGAATRRDIRRRARRVRAAAEQAAYDVTDSVVDTFQQARRKVEEKIDNARQAIDLKKEQLYRAMDAGRAAANEARDEVEQRIAETKAPYGADATTARAVRVTVGDDEMVDGV